MRCKMGESAVELKREADEVLKIEAAQIESQVESLVVDDRESMEYAQETILDIDRLKKRISDYWEPLKGQAHKHWKAIVAKENEMTDPLTSRRTTLKSKVDTYLTAERKKLQEEQRKIDEERRRKEEEERARLQSEAEAALESGDAESAVVLEEAARAVFVPTEIAEPVVEKTVRTDSGTLSQKTEIDVIVTDQMAIIRAVASGQISIGVIEIKAGELKRWAKLQKLSTGNHPDLGVRVEERVSSSFRGKK
jgi:hypothetical protein